MSKNRPKLHIPFPAALSMVRNYARTRVLTQVRSIAFILFYLLAFQLFVLGTTPANGLRVTLGVGMVVFGLTFFLEGLILGLMPLGERVGVQLPRKCGLTMIMGFGLLLGIGSTFAEPAMASLEAAGTGVTAWASPLLFRMLNETPMALVVSIGLGVGVAVAVGMFRFYKGISIKPFIFTVIPLLLVLTLYGSFDENLRQILGLAWDAGAVTTGAVTVPLVLALGIGVSRASGMNEDAAGGFGIIMLASAFPVMGVLVLGMILNVNTPHPLTEEAFFDPEHRETALQFFEDEAALASHAFRFGTAEGRRILAGSEAQHMAWIQELSTPGGRVRLLGGHPIQDWLGNRASEEERGWVAAFGVGRPSIAAGAPVNLGQVLREEGVGALRSVLPLTFLLVVVLVLFLRHHPRHWDEVFLGIGFALVGMLLLTGGIRIGLAPLGDEVGRPLPRMFRSAPREEGRLLIEAFDPAAVVTAFGTDGTREDWFLLRDGPGDPRPVPFDATRYNAETGRYVHIIKSAPMFGPQMTAVGIALVFLFAFGLGFGTTQAEPALAALGRTVESISVGTIRSTAVVRTVSLGVGIGLMAGVARLLYDIPIVWLLIPPYILLLGLTYWSEEDFAGISWDCGGVTTGGITVPLVLAMGLGIGGELGVTEGFGLLAMASLYPIVTMLIFGLVVRTRQRRDVRDTLEEDEDA